MTDRNSDAGNLGGDQLFKNADETERIYAPQTVPGTDIPSTELDADGSAGLGTFRDNERPAGGPVAPIGSNPTGSAAVPNVAGHDEHRGAPGDPETQARYPIGDDTDGGSRGA